jgi:PAS domain S-box-containing protein
MSETFLALAEPAARISPDLSGLLAAPPQFIEMLPLAIYACDAGGRILWFNRRAAGLWGRTPQIGEDSERFCGAYKLYRINGTPLRHAETPMAHVLRAGVPVHGEEVTIERADGSRATAMVHINPILDADGDVVGAINCFHDVTDRKHAEDTLRERERQSRELLDALPAAIYTTDAAGRITFYNQAAVDLSGRRPMLGSDEWCVSWRLYWPDGSPMRHDECPMAMALKENKAVRGAEAVAERPDGTRVPFIPYPTPLRDASGAVIGAVNMLVDITERKAAEKRQKALVDELNHRVKNMLATVQSLAAQTIRGGGAQKKVKEDFERRLFALGSAHDQLSRGGWEAAELGAMLNDLLAPFRSEADDRIRISGEPIQLSPKTALALAMVFHELATNAVKYGALSKPAGVLDVRWKADGGDRGRRLVVNWEESGGPRVRQPKRWGFGTRFLARAIEKELRGSAQISFEPGGVHGRIDVPLEVPSAV